MTRKVYFHWVVRDSRAPSYFRDTLETIAADDSTGLVEPRIYLTGAARPKPTDLRYIITRVRALRTRLCTRLLAS